MRFKYKEIRESGLPFLKRFTMYLPNGSIKIHVILNDDTGDAHTHPWDFFSLLLFGAYKENLDGIQLNHFPLSLLRRTVNQKHRITLYKPFGIKMPVVTVGYYSNKKQLCSLCQDLGYCKSEKS